MNVSGFLSASGRRAMMVVGIAVLLLAGLPAQAQQTAAAKPPDPLKFDYDGPMILLYNVKPERAADFEAAWAGIRAGLAKSADPELKAFAETLYPYKIEGATIYVFRLDPPSKKFSYNPVPLLYDNVNNEAPEKGLFTRKEADDLYGKFNGSYVEGGLNLWKLKKVG